MLRKTLKIKVSGLHCKACELLSEEKLSALKGVDAVRVSHHRGEAEIDYLNNPPNMELVAKELQNLGYSWAGEVNITNKDKRKKWQELSYAIIILLVLILIIKFSGWLNLSNQLNPETMSWGAILLIGLIAGISTCMALVGGIVVALAADYAQRHPRASRAQKFLPHIYFNLGRIIGFFILGGALGSLGSIFKISLSLNAWLTILIGLLIIFLGLQITDIFPIFRRFSFSLPKNITRLLPIKTTERNYRPLAAMSAGAISFFLPCGFTQSMQIYALSTGNFLHGALVMGFFALGTSPGLLSLGGIVSFFKGKSHGLFFKTAGLIIIAFGIFNINNAYQFLKLQANANTGIVINNIVQAKGESQVIYMEQTARGYIPNTLKVEVGRPVRWIITSTNPYSCASSLVIPSLNIHKQLEKGENIIEFSPLEPGLIRFSCSMGMYSGVIEVLTNKNNSSTQNDSTLPSQQEIPQSTCSLNGCF